MRLFWMLGLRGNMISLLRENELKSREGYNFYVSREQFRVFNDMPLPAAIAVTRYEKAKVMLPLQVPAMFSTVRSPISTAFTEV